MICSGGLLYETYPFQVAVNTRDAFWPGETFEISKVSNGRIGGVDAIQTMGKKRRKSQKRIIIP
jgi:hypothetical protein